MERSFWPLAVTSVAVTLLSLLASIGLAFMATLFILRPGSVVLPPLLALPGATLGAVLTWRGGSWWPFCLGIVATLLTPFLILALWAIVDPAPAPFFNGD